MTEIAKLLVDLKVARSQQRKSKVLFGPKYDAFSDAVSRLYSYLDRMPISELERIRSKTPAGAD